MHTLRNTYTNIWFEQEPVVTDSSNQRLPKCFSPQPFDWSLNDSPALEENNRDLNIFQATVTQRYKSCLFSIMTLKHVEEMCGNFKRKYLTCHGCNRGALYFI